MLHTSYRCNFSYGPFFGSFGYNQKLSFLYVITLYIVSSIIHVQDILILFKTQFTYESFQPDVNIIQALC